MTAVIPVEPIVPEGSVDRVDPLLHDLEMLRGLASDPVVRRGIGYFKEERVTGLGWQASKRLWATVEGSVPGMPYEVEVAIEEDGEASYGCSCPFDGEPICKHVVAALLAYGARQAVSQTQVASAAEEALAERVQKARTEVVTRHVGGEPGFGTWEAWSLQPTGFVPRTYRVELRSTSERINHCTCPDFASNRLGTCKHIEAVVAAATKRARGRRGSKGTRPAPAPSVAVVHLDWRDAEPKVRIRRVPDMEPSLAAEVDRWFDAGGELRDDDRAGLLTFADRVAGRTDVQVSQEALDHARRRLEDVAHLARALRIRNEIRSAGGRIDGLRARLYPYQVDGVAFLASTGRAILADDMGLGKTLQAIAASTWMAEREGVARVLVVAPTSLKHQWAREIGRFTGHEAEVVSGSAYRRMQSWKRQARFTVVNYETLMRDHDAVVVHLSPDLLVLDEAQRIKNWRTKTADAVKSIPARYAFVLTGTPLENRLEDLYSIMQVVDRRVLGPLWHFHLEFHVSDERGAVLGYRNLSALRTRLRSVLLRRDRRIVADQLPERIEQRIDVPMTSRQRQLHTAAVQNARQIAEKASRQRRPLTPVELNQLMAALQEARMACDAAGLVDGVTQGSPKLDELGRLLEELCLDGGEKVVVFSQWKKMTDLAAEVCRRLDMGFESLHGGVASERRGELVDRFRDDPDCKVFLSTDAGSTGLNLQCASVLVNLDLPWNPAVLDQRIARVHRLGQKGTVRALLLVASDSYEERILAILHTKRALFAGAFDPESTEEVVGLSRKTLEMAIEALPPEVSRAASENQDPDICYGVPGDPAAPRPDFLDVLVVPEVPRDLGPISPGRSPVTPDPPSAPRGPELDDPALAAAVASLQTRLASRLERVVALRGGLVAVVTRTDPDDSPFAESLAADFPVAVLDAPTFAALTRLGALSSDPSAAPAPPPEPPASRLASLARAKLFLAESLLAAGDEPSDLRAAALDLLATSLAASAAHKAGAADLPSPASLAVWLYADAVPKGLLSPDAAAKVLRANAIAATVDAPASLVAEVLADAWALLPA